MFLLALASVIMGAIGTGFSMSAKNTAAKKQQQALQQQGTIQARQRAKGIKALAGSQKASFMQSGISLTGEGTTQALLDETYDTGIEDIGQIKSNTKAGVSNVWSKARSGMIGDLTSFALNTGLSMATMGAGPAINPTSYNAGAMSGFSGMVPKSGLGFTPITI